METTIYVVLVLLMILTVRNCSKNVSEDLCFDGFCGKRFIGLHITEYSELFSKTCVMNPIVKINFNITLRVHDNLTLTQTSTDGLLLLNLPDVGLSVYFFPLIVDTELGAIMKMKYEWSSAPLVLLPVEKLGTEYFFGVFELFYSLYVFVAVDNNTLMHLYYKKAGAAKVFINRNPINDTMQYEKYWLPLENDSMDVVIINEPGTTSNRHCNRIISNNPVAAFYFSTGPESDLLPVQIKSAGMHGKEYFVYYHHPPFSNTSVIKVVATQNATVVTVSSNSSVVLAKAETVSYFLKPHDSMFVSADKPILVFLIFNSIIGLQLPILAKEQFSSEYLLDLPPGKTTMFLVLPHEAAQHLQLKGVKFNVSEMSERNIDQNMTTAMLVTEETNGVIVELSTNQQFGGISVTTSNDSRLWPPMVIECGLRRISRECRLQTCPSAVCNDSAAEEVCEAPQLLPNTEEKSFRSREQIVIAITVVATGFIGISASVAVKYLKKYYLNRVRPQH